MVESNEINGRQAIEPADFDAPNRSQNRPNKNVEQTRPSTGGRSELAIRSGASWWHSQFNLMLCVFALLAGAAVVFIALAPAPGVPAINTVVSADGETVKGASAVKVDEQSAPWDESRRQQARTDSQDILSELLRAKKDLEQRNIADWGAQEFALALAKAAEGDEFYKRKDFVGAVQSYQDALTQVQALDALIPEVLTGLVTEGQAAIDQGKTELAREKFQQALNLDQNHIPALTGLDRAQTLDQVLELLRGAVLDEQAFLNSDDLQHLSLAADKFQQALVLDSRTEEASLGAQRITGLTADKEYRDAMSTGFSALFNSRYGSAKQGFAAALKVMPDDKTAAAAYRQSLASDKRSSLSSLIASGKRLEKNEEWASALSNYEAVLQRDPNQVNAKLGKIRSQARKQLDQSIKAVLSDTLALSRSTQRSRAEKVLADARAIKVKGGVLNDQIAQIESSLKNVESVVKVSFTSDQLTSVSLRKAGANKINLGKFSTKNLSLKPGRYVVTGMRLGFKDVRQEIELRAQGKEVQSFAIACEVAVGSN